MDEIRIAVVGLGTRSLNWIAVMQRTGGFRVVALCDPVAALHERARTRLERPGEVRVHTRYEEALADPNVDAIALTVRCEEQGALAALALEAGKHVHMEVPGAHRMEDCWRIVAAQERSGKVFQLAEQVRHAGFVEAWRRLVAEGRLGRITYGEGQYFHYYVEKSFQDPATGRFYGPEQIAAHPEAQPTWMCHMPPIHYLPHDLGPMLRILDDRVVEVMAMSTGSPSAAHPELASPDVQVALMKTGKDAILRMAASFAQPHPHVNNHWLHLLGTKGSVEWRRSNRDAPKLWLSDGQMHDKSDMEWRFERTDAPPEARGSGHSDMDYYVHAAFRDAVLGIRPLEYDVYKAMDTTAPAILAAESIAQDGAKLRVPSFRPDATRPPGQMPKSI
ncbi:MAG: Gfo/Idh/MocA family oxidoreductase [Candidatus Latescibacteria bacterium]|nr:Gfo/Idh/MocA family oxidoreductase [Candidatus Latescibacterota bacterium]